jgi:hypothetical protein
MAICVIFKAIKNKKIIMENMTPTVNAEPQITFADTGLDPISPSQGLKGFWKSLKESWDIYRSKFLTLLAIMILPVAFSFFLEILLRLSMSSDMLSQSLLFSIIKTIVWLISLYFDAVAISAVMFCIKEEAGFMDTYWKAFKNSPSFILVFIILCLITLAVSLVVFIPLIVFYLNPFSDSQMIMAFTLIAPFLALLIFSFVYTYLIFSLPVSVFENISGYHPIFRSKQLVSGNFWKIFWRFVVLIILFGIALIIPLLIFAPILGNNTYLIIGAERLFFLPFLIIFLVLLYNNLTEIKTENTSGAPRKITKVLYYLASAIALPVLLAAFVFQFLNMFAYDVPRPNDTDMQLQVLRVPNENNAYFKFAEANDAVYYPSPANDADNLVSNTNWNDALASDVLNKNQKALSAFEVGVALPIYQVPELQNPANFGANVVLKSMSSLRNLAKINSIYALSLLKQGKENEAFWQSLKTIKIGQMMQDGQGSLISYLIGAATKEIGLNNFRILIKNSHLSSPELLSYEKELDKYKESRIALQNTLKAEYIMTMNSKKETESAFSGEKTQNSDELSKAFGKPIAYASRSNFYYKPNESQIYFLENFRKMVDNAGKNYYNQLDMSEPKHFPNGWTIIFTENAVGKTIFNVAGVSLNSVSTKKFQETFSVKGIELLLAIKAYKNDNGSLPDALERLVPNYISGVLLDPFDGKPIRYSAEKKIIYSVGKNLTDDGGNSDDVNWQSGNDLVFKIDF